MGKRKRMQMTKTKEKRETTLFDLPVEDIMMTHVAQYLKIRDLKNLRLCSRKYKYIADVMFAGIRTFESYFTERGISLFLKKTRRLRTFKIYINANYSEEIVHEVLSNNYLLNAVVISFRSNITTWGLMPIAEYCKNISYLELVYVPISDDFLRALGRHKLIYVSFHIDELNDKKERPSQAALQTFFEKQMNIGKVHLLHTIDLSPIVSTIANYCPNLKFLSIEDCVLYDDKVLIELANKCPKLEHLTVSRVTPSVSDVVLKEMRSKNKYQRLMIYERDSYSDFNEDGYDSDDLLVGQHALILNFKEADEGESSEEDVEDIAI